MKRYDGDQPFTRSSGECLTAAAVRHYRAPQTLGDFKRLFPDDTSCRMYLVALRWPHGVACFRCPGGGQVEVSERGLLRCRSCNTMSSPTTGTALDGSPVPLRAWFRAVWEIASSDAGANLATLAPLLPVARPQFAWGWLTAMQGIYRKAWRRLHGVVEVAKVVVDVAHDGDSRCPRSKHATVAVAIEARGRGKSGRALVQRLPSVDARSMIAFVRSAVSEGGCVRTGNWLGYSRLRDHGYGHITTIDRRDGEAAALGHVYQLSSIMRLWLWSSDAVSDQRLDYYLDEFNFRFNARLVHPANDRGALFDEILRLAVAPESPARAAGFG